MKRRVRDYRKEYAERVKRGLSKGYSQARSRGHARAGDFQKPKTAVADPNDRREKALLLMKAGATQKAAAKQMGIPVEKLRRYIKENTTAKLRGKKWIIVDKRPVEMRIAARGRIAVVPVRYRSKSAIGHYWNAVNAFLDTNDISHLKPFHGKRLRDAKGNAHTLETDPNILRKLDSVGELQFVEIYSQTAQ